MPLVPVNLGAPKEPQRPKGTPKEPQKEPQKDPQKEPPKGALNVPSTEVTPSKGHSLYAPTLCIPVVAGEGLLTR